MLFLGDLPLRGAAGIEKGRCFFWGSCRCAGLLDYEREEALSLGELPLLGAAGLQKGRCGFWGISRCAGLLEYIEKGSCSFWGRAPAAPAADVCQPPSALNPI